MKHVSQEKGNLKRRVLVTHSFGKEKKDREESKELVLLSRPQSFETIN